MTSPTQRLRDEHRELLPHIAFMRSAADIIGQAVIDDVREDVDEVLGFLGHELIPHAEIEERVFYPAVAKALGSPEATRTMSRDHVEVGRLVEQLRILRSRLNGSDIPVTDARELRRVLYGLYALVSLHFSKEEEIYLPLLDERLTAEETRALVHAMEDVGRVAHAG